MPRREGSYSKIVGCTSKVQKFFVSEDRAISQQNARRKAYEEKLKNKAKDMPKDKKVGK